MLLVLFTLEDFIRLRNQSRAESSLPAGQQVEDTTQAL
jgi:hypothetical protein